MDTLTLFGFIIFFTAGTMTGAAVMYFAGLIIDRKFDRQEETS